MRFRRPVVLPDVPVELLDGPFDAVALARARALGLDVVELVKMRGNRRLLRAGLPPRARRSDPSQDIFAEEAALSGSQSA